MDVGSVRMRERRLVSDPATSAEIDAARHDIRQALDEAEQHVNLGQARTIVGLAGTITSVAALSLGLTEYDPQRIHGLQMSVGHIEQATQWFIDATFDERRSVAFLHPQRADVMNAGALVWQEVVRRIVLRSEQAGHRLDSVMISEHDILDGLALRAAGVLA